MPDKAKKNKRKNKSEQKQNQTQYQHPSNEMANIPFTCIVKPVGARCNLRCEHCFYLDKNDLYEPVPDGVMPEELLEQFIRDFIESQPPGAREVTFVWQGGEPTLAGLDFFRRAVELEQRHAPSHMQVHNSIQTNGTLLDDQWGEFLHQHQFLVGISIDGPEHLHNRFRPDAAGRGSFAGAMRGLEILKKYQVEFNILTCVQSDNAEHGAEVYDFLKAQGATFIQFIPIVEHLTGPPAPADPHPPEPETEFRLTERSVSGEQYGRFMSEVFDRWLDGDVGRIFVQSFDVCLGLMLGYPAAVCVQSRRCGRGIVVEHNGQVYACDHYVFPEYLIGSLNEEKGLRELCDSPFQCAFGAAKETGLPQTCRECSFLPLCNGGCPAQRTDPGKYGEPGLNHLCSGYRMFYQHAFPVLQAMGKALQQKRPAADWKNFYTGIPDS